MTDLRPIGGLRAGDGSTLEPVRFDGLIAKPGISRIDQRDGSTDTGAVRCWRSGIGHVMLLRSQPDGSPIDDRLLPGQTNRASLDAKRYYPMDVHVSAILVESGGTFPGWP